MGGASEIEIVEQDVESEQNDLGGGQVLSGQQSFGDIQRSSNRSAAAGLGNQQETF